MAHVYWQSFFAKLLATATRTLLALTTLGDVTQIGLFQFLLCRPMKAKVRIDGVIVA
jgi:hypothetical protein